MILPNRLREKVGGVPGKMGSINPEAIEKAERKVEEIAVDYPDFAAKEIGELQDAFQKCQEPGGDQAAYLKKINRLVHDMRGQGSSFGFPLLTEFANSLFHFTDTITSASFEQMEIIKAHIDVMHIVAQQKMRGDGGAVGQQLKQTLKIAIEKYS